MLRTIGDLWRTCRVPGEPLLFGHRRAGMEKRAWAVRASEFVSETLRRSIGVKLWLVLGALSLARYLFFLALLVLSVPLLTWNGLVYVFFNMMSVAESYAEFNRWAARDGIGDGQPGECVPGSVWRQLDKLEARKQVDAEGYEHFESAAAWRDEMATRHVLEPYRLENRALDSLLTAYFYVLDVASLISPSSSLIWRSNSQAAHHRHFRQFLSLKPPAFPLSLFDYTYVHDTVESPCEVVGMMTTGRLSLAEWRHTFLHRCAMVNVKMRSVLGGRYARLCWVPQWLDVQQILGGVGVGVTSRPAHLGADCRKVEALPVFDIAEHVVVEPIDLKSVDLYTRVSEIASQCLPRSKPLWKVIVLQPTNEDLFLAVPKYEPRPLQQKVDDENPQEHRPPPILQAACSPSALDGMNSPDCSPVAGGEPRTWNLGGADGVRAIRVRATDVSVAVMVCHHVLGDGVSLSCAGGNLIDPFNYPNTVVGDNLTVIEPPGSSGPTRVRVKSEFCSKRPFILPGVDDPSPFHHIRLTLPEVLNRTEKVRTISVVATSTRLPWYSVPLYYFGHLITGIGLVMSFLSFWCFYAPSRKSIFAQEVAGKRKRRVTGSRHLTPPMVLTIKEVSRLSRQIHKLMGNNTAKPTLNDMMTFCVAAAFSHLRDPHTLTLIKKQALQPQPAPPVGDYPLYFVQNRDCLTGDNFSSLLQINDAGDEEEACGSVVVSPRPSATKSATTLDLLPNAECNPSTRAWTSELFDALESLPLHPHAEFFRYASDFERYLSVLVPMAVRTSLPTGLDNLTSHIIVRLPLASAVEDQMRKEIRYATNTTTKSSVFESFQNFLLKRDPSKRLLDRVLISSQASTPSKAVKQTILLIKKLRHLLGIRGELNSMKRVNARAKNFIIMCGVVAVMPECLVRILSNHVCSKAQAIFTNVLGPCTSGTVKGQPVLSLQSWIPTRGELSVGIETLSFGDLLQTFVSMDEAELLDLFEAEPLEPDQMRNVARLITDLIQYEFYELNHLVQEALNHKATNHQVKSSLKDPLKM